MLNQKTGLECSIVQLLQSPKAVGNFTVLQITFQAINCYRTGFGKKICFWISVT